MAYTPHTNGWLALVVALGAFSSATACDDDGDSAGNDDGGSAGRGGGSSAGRGGGSGSGQGAGSGGGAGSTGDAGMDSVCSPAVSGSALAIADAEGPSAASMVAWTGDGLVAVERGAMGSYRIVEIDARGEPRGAARTPWPDQTASENASIAVSGDVLALVDRGLDPGTQRPVCRLALVQLNGGDLLQPPTRFSDPPEIESVFDEAQDCDVASVGDAFLAVWHQQVSRTGLSVSSFAQWFERDGQPRGQRLTLAKGGEVKREPISITADGTRAVVALSGTKGDEKGGGSSLLFVEREQVRTVPLALGGAVGPVAIQAAHDGFIAQTFDEFWLLDRDGRSAHGPVNVTPGSLVAPLGDGYVVVSRDEFLVMRSWSADLAASSSPVGLSTDRSAFPRALAHAPDGSWTAALFGEGGKLRFAALSCGGEQQPPPGPASCRRQVPLQPLDDQCDEGVCHVAIRLDYLTLGVLGWTAVGGDNDPVDAPAALGAAQDVFDAHSEYVGKSEISGPVGGLFTAFASPTDFGAFALIGQDSGLVITAGGVVWSGRGAYWVPETWGSAADIACGRDMVTPAEVQVEDAGGCTDFEDTKPPAPRAALDVALRSNLAAHVAAQGPFTARVYLYTPTVGACDAGAAEYLVVLTQAR